MPPLEDVCARQPKEGNRVTAEQVCDLRGGGEGSDSGSFGTEATPTQTKSRALSPPGRSKSNPTQTGGPQPLHATKPETSQFDLPPPKLTTKLFLPRTSGVGAGFFDEIEVTREEADDIRNNGCEFTRAANLGIHRGLAIRQWS